MFFSTCHRTQQHGQKHTRDEQSCPRVLSNGRVLFVVRSLEWGGASWSDDVVVTISVRGLRAAEFGCGGP